MELINLTIILKFFILSNVFRPVLLNIQYYICRSAVAVQPKLPQNFEFNKFCFLFLYFESQPQQLRKIMKWICNNNMFLKIKIKRWINSILQFYFVNTKYFQGRSKIQDKQYKMRKCMPHLKFVSKISTTANRAMCWHKNNYMYVTNNIF